jgi:type III secretion protein L
MVIWLSDARAATSDAQTMRFGVHGDIIARETFGALVDLNEAYARAEQDAQSELETAREAAARIVEAAREEAQDLIDAAKHEHAQAAQRGFEEGMAQGIAQWLESIAQAGGEARASETHMRSRMAEIVAMAAEQIVQAERPGALFERALIAVDGIVEGSTYLRVAVHPDDLDDARAAFDAFASRWRELGRPLPLTVTADARLERSSCLCESDLGLIDASVTTQLRTMRAAISRALKASVQT